MRHLSTLTAHSLLANLLLASSVLLDPSGAARAQTLPQAPTVVAVDHFDTNVDDWTGGSRGLDLIEWSPMDAAGNEHSGAIRVLGSNLGLYAGGLASACVGNVSPGTAYQVRAYAFNDARPGLPSRAYLRILFSKDTECEEVTGVPAVSAYDRTPNAWQEVRASATAPEDARSLRVDLVWDGVPGESAVFDDVALLTGVVPVPAPGAWIQTPDLPRFQFQVRISGPSGESYLGTQVADCIADAICFGGALPERAELEIRSIGPRPNGYVWPVIVQLTPSEVEVWIETLDTKERRYYHLRPADRGLDQLGGFFDRRGFLPPLE